MYRFFHWASMQQKNKFVGEKEVSYLSFWPVQWYQPHSCSSPWWCTLGSLFDWQWWWHGKLLLLQAEENKEEKVNCKSRLQKKMNWRTEPYFSLFSNNSSGVDSAFSIEKDTVLGNRELTQPQSLGVRSNHSQAVLANRGYSCPSTNTAPWLPAPQERSRPSSWWVSSLPPSHLSASDFYPAVGRRTKQGNIALARRQPPSFPWQLTLCNLYIRIR